MLLTKDNSVKPDLAISDTFSIIFRDHYFFQESILFMIDDEKEKIGCPDKIDWSLRIEYSKVSFLSH